VVLLECENLTVNFGGLVAVNEVDFSVQTGEVVGLIGPNGSGKSTLFNLITGIYPPSNGRTVFKDVPITGKTPAEISRMGVARTFQNSRLFLELSILDNVLSGMWYREHSGILNPLFLRKKFHCCGISLKSWDPTLTRKLAISPSEIVDDWKSVGLWPPIRISCCWTNLRQGWIQKKPGP
jgi:ABC-type sugar transport system ATPase subunit